jgi:hypothetical protein
MLPTRDIYASNRREFILGLLGSLLHPLMFTHIYYNGKDYYL